MLVDFHVERRQGFAFEKCPLVARITDVEHLTAWGEAGAEVLDHRLEKYVLPAGRQGEGRAIRKRERDAIHLARSRVAGLEPRQLREERSTANCQ